MNRKVLAMAAILSLALTTFAFAQSSSPSDQGNRPGPGYGGEPDQGYGCGPGYGYGMGPWMGGGRHGGYGMGPGMMGRGYGPGYGWGPGMMGRGYGYGPGDGGYGYGPGQGQSYRNLSPEEQEARAKAFADEYVRHNLPGYSLEKKSPTKNK